MEVIDRKFVILAVNPANGHNYDEHDSLLLCAKDKAVPAALEAYYLECVRLGCSEAHLESITLLRKRVFQYQKEITSKIPDTEGVEIDRCIKGIL